MRLVKREPIYLDYNATTPLLPEVLDAMLPLLRDGFGNPSSGHARGRAARGAVERARQQVADLVGRAADEVVFTGSGTEASNLALAGLARAHSQKRRLVTTSIEHPATLEPCRRLAQDGYELVIVPVEPDGRVTTRAVLDALTPDTLCVSVMHANNETGALQPAAEIAAQARAQGIPVHVDAAQSAGKVPIGELDADLLTLAGHKLYAPKGVGALVVRRGTTLAPQLLGGGQERGLRPGTENVASIVGFGAACALAARELPARQARLRALASGLLWRLRAELPGLVLNGPELERLPNTVNVSFPDLVGRELLERIPELEASTGSACHSDAEHPSAVLAAMGVSRERALGAVRLSVGVLTTEEQIERAAACLVSAARSLRSG